MTARHAMLAMVLGILGLSASAHADPAEETLVSVSGEVTVNGAPLARGRIYFYLDDDHFVGSKIKDGAYEVKRVPVGTCRVELKGKGIPARTSFAVQAKVGNNTFDFDVKGR